MEPLLCRINKITANEAFIELSPLEIAKRMNTPIIFNLIASFTGDLLSEMKDYFTVDDTLLERADLTNPFFVGYISFNDVKLTAYDFELERLETEDIALVVHEIRKFYKAPV